MFPITVDRGYRAHFRAMSRWLNAGGENSSHPKPTRFIQVRCGKCPNCLKQKRREWLLRLHYHLNAQEYPSYFVTLTYRVRPRGGVSKKDVQDFFKRLRHAQKEKFTYFLCSEYSPKFREHYHLILYNFSADTEEIVKAWKHGFVFVGDVTDASINYCAKYFINKQDHPEGLNENFSLMSKGIGKILINKDMQKYLQDGNSLRIDGTKVSTPRYIAEKLNLDTYMMPYEEKIEEKLNHFTKLQIDAYNKHAQTEKAKITKRKNV